MKLSKTDKNRTLHVNEEDGVFILTERVSYRPAGYSKNKWDESRIALTPEEVRKLAELVAEKERQ